MTLVVYDGSYEGFLSAVFDVYEYRLTDVRFTAEEQYQQGIFGLVHQARTEEQKVKRVYKGMEQRLSKHALSQLYKAFLSEIRDMEVVLLDYLRYTFRSNATMEHDYSHPSVLKVQQTARMVHREKHRMEAFVRFQLTADGLYYSMIDPDFNVLPLISRHFRERYADQCWMIYDNRRKYGLYYDLRQVTGVSMSFGDGAGNGADIRQICDEKEMLYQKLWQQYFTSVNIAARKNMKLHIQHMPKRYWKYLPEKR